MLEPGATSELNRSLGLPAALSVVIGSMLGIGIFVIPPEVAQYTGDLGLFYVIWLVGGLVAFAGADSFAELGAMYPKAGGDFTFQRVAFGPSVAFATGCLLFLGVFGGSIAAIAVPIWEFQISQLAGVDFGKLVFSLGSVEISAAQLGAVGLVLLFSAINCARSVHWSRLQFILTLIPLCLLTLLALFVVFQVAPTAPLNESYPPVQSGMGGLVSAYVGVYFAYSGWNAIIYLAGEVRTPNRTLPLSLMGGTLAVTFLYLLLCYAFVTVLGIQGLAQAGEAGSATATKLSPTFGSICMNVLIACALLASLNASIMGGARIAFAMARSQMFTPILGRVSGKSEQPVAALWVQGAWVILLVLTGTFEKLIQLTGLAMLVTGSLTVLALFRLRFIEPERPRPYRSLLYPLLPCLYLIGSLGVLAFKVIEGFQAQNPDWFPLIGLMIFCLALVGHLVWDREPTRPTPVSDIE